MTEESCVICLEDMHETFKGGPTKLHCGHSFCKYCIEAWFRVNKKCPMCRAKGQILPSGSMPLRGIRRICPTPGNSSDDDHSEVVRCPIDYCYSRIQSRNFDTHMTRCHRLVPVPGLRGGYDETSDQASPGARLCAPTRPLPRRRLSAIHFVQHAPATGNGLRIPRTSRCRAAPGTSLVWRSQLFAVRGGLSDPGKFP
jgi:hypothetical protein